MDDGRAPDHGHPISSPCKPSAQMSYKHSIYTHTLVWDKLCYTRMDNFIAGIIKCNIV